MENGVSPLNYTVSNTGNATLTQWTLTPCAAGTINVSPLSGTSILASGNATSTGTYTAPGTAGPDSITGSVSSSQAGVVNSPATSTPIAVNVGVATPAAGGPHAATATFGTPLYSQAAAGANYANLASLVNGTGGALGTAATMLLGTNTSGSTQVPEHGLAHPGYR